MTQKITRIRSRILVDARSGAVSRSMLDRISDSWINLVGAV